MKYFSMFSGIGGFELGIERAYDNRTILQESVSQTDRTLPITESRQVRPSCVGYSEINKHAIKVYESKFGGHKNYGDCTKINYSEVPNFNLLVGGSPCQDLSVAGKQKGLSGERSGLFFEFVRCLKEKKPEYFVWENVKGALSSNLGWDFARVQIEFSKAGYDIQWLLCNSKDFGVPQNRERIFIIGTRTGSFREILPFRGTDTKFNEKNAKEQITSTLQHPGHSGGNYKGMNMIGTLRTFHDGNGFREIKSGLSPTIPARAREDGNGLPILAIHVLTPDREKGQMGRRFKEDGEPMFTLTGQDLHGVAMQNMRIRRLTPIECARLQGFPDDWCSILSDTQQYCCYGNAVTVNVIEAIMRRLL